MTDAPPQEPRPLQFSIATVMGVTAGVAILLSLSMWSWFYGSPSAVVLVCGLWATMAVRAGYRRLAYYLIGAGVGPITLAIVLTPIRMIQDLPAPSAQVDRPFLLFLLVAVVSTLTTTRLLRRFIREPGGMCFGSAAACVYVTAMVVWAFIVLGSLMIGGFQHSLWILAMGIVVVPVVGTLFLPVAGPVAYCCVRLLRYVDPAEADE